MPADDQRDARLAMLLEQLSAGGNAEQLAAANPDLAAELRELWAAHQIAAALAPSRSTVSLPIDSRPAAEAREVPNDFGDFELLRELGRGGMGVVYLARQKSLGRLVALKMILYGGMASESDRSRFRAEATAAAGLIHPNIVAVFEAGEHEGRPWFAMPYVEGTTLARRLEAGPLPPREAAALVATLARAVQHAHEAGIVHRDLKPSNILLGDHGSGTASGVEHTAPAPDSRIPSIVDFGLARRVDQPGMTQSGQIIGTPSYMAPEQAAGRKDIGPAVDIHALGAILYECLTGRPPFRAASTLDTVMQVLEQEPAAPRLLNVAVPRELEAICLKCLEKAPRRRYESATALAADLDAYLQGDRVSATPSGLIYYLDRIFRETHHAEVMENWGVLWMWHSLATLVLCTVTQVLDWTGYGSHTAYLCLWGIGLVTWGAIFWSLRRRGGPVRFVERQVAHAWAAGVCASVGMFILEVLMDQPPLTFSPLLALAAGMVFLVKAGVLTGIFYIAAVAMFITAVLMALFPQVGVLLFGITTAGSFFFPGLKYYRQRLLTHSTHRL